MTVPMTVEVANDVLIQMLDRLDTLPHCAKARLGEFIRLYLIDFISFLERLLEKWRQSKPYLREKYAYNIALLTSKKARGNTLRARYNAFIAYLVHRKVITSYEAIYVYRLVPGGESIYTWLRMYRDLGVEP